MKIGVVLLGAVTLAMWFGMSSINKKKEALTEDVQRLEKKATQKDLVFEELLGLIDDVESQIDDILERENIVLQHGEQIQQGQKERIAKEIQMIDDLILRSAIDIQKLNDQLRASGLKMNHFQKKVNGLQADLKDRVQEIVSLKEDLVAKDEALAFLINEKDSLQSQTKAYVGEISQKNFQIDQLTALNTELNKGYLAVGTFNELKDKGVVRKEGGFLGVLGRKKTLQEDASLTAFMAVDKREVSRLRFEANELELISEHPSDSYAIVPGETDRIKVLEITDPDAFWQISQYLVISKRT